MVSAFKNIEHAGLIMVVYYTHGRNSSFFVLSNFEVSCILYPLLIRGRRSFQAFTVKFCHTDKKLVKFRQFNFERYDSVGARIW